MKILLLKVKVFVGSILLLNHVNIVSIVQTVPPIHFSRMLTLSCFVKYSITGNMILIVYNVGD